jgi:hypothetical protein
VPRIDPRSAYCGRLPPLLVSHEQRRGEPELIRSTTQSGLPGCPPRDRVQAPELEAPVVTSLTDAERAELARKAAEANKRSQDNTLARGGR